MKPLSKTQKEHQQRNR